VEPVDQASYYCSPNRVWGTMFRCLHQQTRRTARIEPCKSGKRNLSLPMTAAPHRDAPVGNTVPWGWRPLAGGDKARQRASNGRGGPSGDGGRIVAAGLGCGG
jgi:hypothetical protein